MTSIHLLATTLPQKSLCGSDDRQFSFDNRIGKVIPKREDRIGCTATMISDSCAITAGHCVDYLHWMEFNVPHPEFGVYPNKKESDLFEIDRESIVYQDDTTSDWAVFRVKANRETEKLPGELYGHYDISYWAPFSHDELSISGYGVERDRVEHNALQHIGWGEVTKIDSKKRRLYYRVDTLGGNSGSAVINLRTGEIVAIHTNGGCNMNGSDNFGTLIGKVSGLKSAIRFCLKSEKVAK